MSGCSARFDCPTATGIRPREADTTDHRQVKGAIIDVTARCENASVIAAVAACTCAGA